MWADLTQTICKSAFQGRIHSLKWQSKQFGIENTHMSAWPVALQSVKRWCQLLDKFMDQGFSYLCSVFKS